MLNGLRALVSWMDAVLSAEVTRSMAEETYDHMMSEIHRSTERAKARKEEKDRNSAFLQNVLLTTIPEVIKAFTQRSPSSPLTGFPTPDSDRPVTVHRRKPSLEEVQHAEPAKDLDPKAGDPLMSLEERVTILEKILSGRQCVLAEADSILNRHRTPGAVGVKVIRADQFADWAKGFVDSLKVQRAASPAEECTPADTSSSCEDTLD